MKKNYQPAWTIFKKSRDIVLANWKLFGLIYIFPLVGGVVSGFDRLHHAATSTSYWGFMLKGTLPGNGSQSFGENAVFVTILAVLSFVSALALTVAATRYAQGRKPTFREVMSELMDKGVRLILLTLLSGILTLVGFLLLVIPGVFVLGRLYLSQYVLINENTGVIEAMKKSWNLTKGRMWTTYSLIMLTLLFALATIMPLAGPLIATTLALLFGVGPAIRYFELKHTK